MAKAKGIKPLAQNRKAFHDYFILEKFEAGIELCGTEVKSCRGGQVNMKDSFCGVKNGEMLVRGLHISPYAQGNIFNRDPDRERRLLLHKREIHYLYDKIRMDGLTVVPLSMYLKDSRVKLEIGLARGKKLYDKRDDAARRDAGREIDRAMKERNV